MSQLRVCDTSKRMVKICSPRPCRNMDVARAKEWLMHTHGQLQLLPVHVSTVAIHTLTPTQDYQTRQKHSVTDLQQKWSKGTWGRAALGQKRSWLSMSRCARQGTARQERASSARCESLPVQSTSSTHLCNAWCWCIACLGVRHGALAIGGHGEAAAWGAPPMRCRP